MKKALELELESARTKLAEALATMPVDASPCPAVFGQFPCDPPFTAARLAHYRGFAGFTSPPVVTVLAPDELRRDAIVWVLVRRDEDFATVRAGHSLLTTAVLVDAVTGEVVTSGALLPAS